MRILSFDPGSRHLGWALLDVATRRPAWLAGGSLDAPVLPDPRAPPQNPDPLGGAILALIERARPGALALELPVWMGGRDGRSARAGRALLGTIRVHGIGVGVALARGLPYVELPAATWRSAVTGKLNASDKLIASALRRFLALPPRSNSHGRDAAGLGLAAAWMLLAKDRAARGRVVTHAT